MTIVEKAAYLRGLAEGLEMESTSKEGKLWGALFDLLSDVAHEIEDLQESNLDHAEALDDISEELSYLEELVCDLDIPEDLCEDCEDGDCSRCRLCEDGDDDEDDDDELEYDGIVYDVHCPVCGEEVSFDEETLEMGSINCPQCGELLEFDFSDDEEEENN